MRRNRLAAKVLAAIMAVSVCMPANGNVMTAMAAENEGVTAAIDAHFEKLFAILETYLPQIGSQLVLDTGALVAETAPAMDRELGLITKRRERR